MSVNIAFNMTQLYVESVTCLQDNSNFFNMLSVTGARLSQLFVSLDAPSMMRLIMKSAVGSGCPISLWKKATADSVDSTVATALPCDKRHDIYAAKVATVVGNQGPLNLTWANAWSLLKACAYIFLVPGASDATIYLHVTGTRAATGVEIGLALAPILA